MSLHPKGSITTYEELQNCIVLDLELWVWNVHNGFIYSIKGMLLHPMSEDTFLVTKVGPSRQLKHYSIPDPLSISDQIEPSMFLFNTEEEARSNIYEFDYVNHNYIYGRKK